MIKTDWEPMTGWLMLVPVKLPDKTEGGIVLPEEFVTKSTSGICVKAGHDIDKDLIGKELFFPRHEEHRIIDTDTGQLFYVIPSDRIILKRKAVEQPDFLVVNAQGTRPIQPFIRSK